MSSVNPLAVYLDTVDHKKTTMKDIYTTFSIKKSDRKEVKQFVKEYLFTPEIKRLKSILFRSGIFKFRKERNMNKLQKAVNEIYGSLFPTKHEIKKIKKKTDLERELKNMYT